MHFSAVTSSLPPSVSQARSRCGASGSNAPTTNLEAPTTNLQNVKHKRADQLAKERATPCRIHVLPLLNPPRWKKANFQKCSNAYTRCFAQCYRARFVVKVLIL